MTKEQTFENLVKQNKSTIYSICYMFSEDQEEVNDLFQDILLHLWLGFDKFRGASNINTWIYRVSLNTCISSDRKKKRAGERVELTMDLDLFAESNKDTKQVKQLYNRIHQLGLVDRAIVMLWLENLSYEEIGLIIGISPTNVGIKLNRIKEQLKSM